MFVVACCSWAYAQVNAEVLAAKVREPGPALLLDGTLGLSVGNVDALRLGGSLVAQWMSIWDAPAGPPPFLRDRVLLAASARQAQYGGDVVENGGLAHLRYTRMWAPRFGTELFAQAQYDEFLLLSRRLVAGGGVRVDAVHREKAGLWGGTGIMAEDELLSDGTETFVWRSTSFLSGRIALAPYLLLLNTAYVQPNLADPADVRVLDELRMETAVTGALSLGTSAALRYDSQPPAGVEPLDFSLGVTAAVRLTRKPEEGT